MTLRLQLTPQQSPAPFLGSAELLGYTVKQTLDLLEYDRAGETSYTDLIDCFEAIKPEGYQLALTII